MEMVSTRRTCWSEAETQTEGPQTPQADAYTQTDLTRIKRAAQTLSSRQLQSLEVPQVLKAELGVMRASVPSWMNFSKRWLCCERSSSDYIASRNLSGRLTNGIMSWHRPSNSPALNPGKGKVNKLPALNKHIWKFHRTKESGPLSLPRTGGVLAPKVPLCNRYDARERRLWE